MYPTECQIEAEMVQKLYYTNLYDKVCFKQKCTRIFKSYCNIIAQ